MPKIRSFRAMAAAVLLLAATAPVAQAGPDVSGTVLIDEPNGYPGVCDQPCFTGTKNCEVYYPDNPDNPLPLAGNNTYLYTVTHTGGTGTPLGIIPNVIEFELEADTCFVTNAGFLDTPAACTGSGVPHPCCTGPGTGPTCAATAVAPEGGTQVGSCSPPLPVVTWTFNVLGDPTKPGIASGQTSEPLYVHSPLLPGTVDDNTVSLTGQLSLDAPLSCFGPFVQPQEEGEPMPCTIGFWRKCTQIEDCADHFFPGSNFIIDPDLLDAAAALSGGIFADGAALKAALLTKDTDTMPLTEEEKAERQLAALFLNLATGDADIDNQKCRLFEGNDIDMNACGSDITVGEALTNIFDWYNAGMYEMAKDCADHLNNGIGVIGVIYAE